MNVSLQKLFLGLLFLLAIPLAAWSQQVQIETYRNIPVDYQFSSFPSKPAIVTRPANGTAVITDLGQNNYRLTYRPKTSFIGKDQVVFTVWNGTSWGLRSLRITVQPSQVDARPDLVQTYQNTPVDIDVVVNDIASSGSLTLKSILLVNNGTAKIMDDGDVVQFMPSADFRGLAQLNYVVCDEYGTCDQGTVSINVLGPATPAPDTTVIFTKKNKAQSVLIPKEFKVTQAPAHGRYDMDSDLPAYLPDAGYTGKDYVTLSDGMRVKVVDVTVLDVVDNTFAFDDEFYTSQNASVEFNVLQNDYYGVTSGCIEVQQPEFGKVELNGYPNGAVTYSPPNGFTGIDKFTYTIKSPTCTGAPETATVYLHVSNFEPAYAKFKMVTPRKTPLIIGYNVPIRNFEFRITDQAELGKAVFLRGKVDTVIYGQRIQGNNIILYSPGENVQSGTDEFEIEYCVVKNQTCQYRKVVKIEVDILNVSENAKTMCIDDCIWAGDTNLDGIVNMEDLLPLGIYMGKVGLPRQETNMDLWYGQYGEDWGPTEGNTTKDIKHIDTNGDSLITGLDTLAISRFYGNTHSLAPVRLPNYRHLIELSGDVFASPGDLIELDMLLGSESDPAVNVYGFTFPFEYNTDFFVPESTKVEYNSDSWLAYGSPVIAMSKNNNQGLLESGFTRTNGASVSGFGKIGRIKIVVDDIAGFRPGDEELTTELGGGVATVMGSSGQTFGVKIGTVTIHINLNKPKEEELDDPALAEYLLKVYPNPTGDFLNVHLNGGHEFRRVLLHNLAGQQVFDSGALQARSHVLNLSNLQTGIYFLSVQTARGVIREKVEVVR